MLLKKNKEVYQITSFIQKRKSFERGGVTVRKEICYINHHSINLLFEINRKIKKLPKQSFSECSQNLKKVFKFFFFNL